MEKKEGEEEGEVEKVLIHVVFVHVFLSNKNSRFRGGGENYSMEINVPSHCGGIRKKNGL